PPLYVGQRVRVRNHVDKTWFPATVSEKCNEPRSYIVSTPNGRQLRRNRGQLRELEPRPTQYITRFANQTGDDLPNDRQSFPTEANASDIPPDPGTCTLSPTRRSTRTRRVPEHLRDYRLN
ncbi:hypothetical protein LSAT2_032566, partial [Lamellibrachia satsuma]